MLVDTTDRICTITLHRPEARNALNVAVLDASVDALLAADASDEVDVVIITGTDPAFCAGMDLKELATGVNSITRVRADGLVGSPMECLWTMTKPVIGAINGVTVTGGLELALACDFLVASDRASFADTHARVGVIPGARLSVLLPMAVGVRKAKEMSLTGNFIDAREAQRLGLVNHVVPHDELLPTCRKIATDIRGNDQRGVRNLKRLYDETVALAPGDAYRHEYTVNRAYQVDRAEIGRRSESIMDRGRTQTR